ncbi:MAG: VanW family protein [Faecousia sp.]
MSKGKFSNPRPYREEEREIEKSFRQLTGQEQPPKPENTVFPESSVSDLDAADPEAASLLSEADSLIPEIEESFPEEAPEDTATSFLTKVLSFVDNNQKPVMVALCAAALVLIISLIAIFFVSASGDPYGKRILNNVTVAGVNVGGMSKADAIAAVRKATDQTYTKQDMVVSLGDTTLRLSPDDTGAKLDVKAAVNAAYDYGRTGTKAERQEAYEASLRSNHTIGLLPYLDLDEGYIRGVLEDYAGDTGSLLTQTSYELEGDIPELAADKFDEERAPELTLVITMGTPGVNFDIEGLLDQILDAYSLNVFCVEAEDAEAGAEPEEVDLQVIFDEVCVAPVDASVNMQTYEAVPGSYGYEFDLIQAQKQVSAAQYGEVVRIPMEYIAPEILGDDVFFRDVLATVKTPHSNNANRTDNLKLACAALNGVVLNPGDTFSFNNTLGERTTAKGYKSAPAYSGSDLVNEVGGGICQVSSTLYCSALLADLEIVARSSHSFPVSYIDYGMDATVSWRSPDFKFRNSTNYPIKIEAEVSGGYVSIQILGTDEKDYYVEMSYVISSTYQPETEYKDFKADNPEGYKDGDVIQEGTTGYLVKTYKSKYNKATGALLSKDFVAESRYKTVNQVVARVEAEPSEPSTSPTEPSTAPTEPSTQPPSTDGDGSDSGDGGTDSENKDPVAPSGEAPAPEPDTDEDPQE